MKVALFDAKPYDRESFDRENENYGYTIKYFPSRLTEDNIPLTADFDAVCIFVNDTITSDMIDTL
ncbi:MAG: 2-hydroxyacid dehydrogenase, partial [Spirochaetota bacterium]